MIRNLLATTAVATLISTGAIAQTTTPTQPATQDPAAATMQQDAPMQIKAEGNLASNIIGEEVYNGTGDDAENIGEVNDLVIGKDGSIQAVVIGVGGFAARRAEACLGERGVRVGQILHPSPANPRANRNWEGEVRDQLSALGLCRR